MKFFLILTGTLVILAGGAWWVMMGAHTGWTKTSVAVHKIDEITEIPYVDYDKRLVPGIEFPVAFLGVGAVLAGAGWWVGRKKR